MPRIAIRSILVATDLTDGSDDIVRAASELAVQIGADLHVVHAVEVRGGPFWESGFDLARLQGVIEESRTTLQTQLSRVLPDGVVAASEKLDFQAGPVAILRRAKEVAADLIVLGPHRPRLPASYLLGTTAQKVVEEATVPCLVTRGPLSSPLERILFPVAEADVARGLVGVAGAWLASLRRQQEASTAGRVDTELRVLHVVRSPEDWREFSEEFAGAIRSASAETGLESYLRLRRAVAWSRSPATEIVRVAKDLDVDVIAMGMRGHGPLMRALLGSVSTNVLRHTSAPVLLFPPRFCEQLPQSKPPSPLSRELTFLARETRLTPAVPRDAEAEWHLMYLDSDGSDDEQETATVQAVR